MDKIQIKNMISNGPNMTILEVGAADGNDTRHFVEVFGDMENFRLFSFEPDPRNMEILKKVGIVTDPRVHLFELAVGAVSGKAILNQSSTMFSSSLKKPTSYLSKTWPQITFGEEVEVDVTTIDDFVMEQDIEVIDFLWADVQGAEDLLFSGASETLKNNKIRYIHTEYSNIPYYEQEPSLQDILNILGNGWEVVYNYDYGCGDGDIFLRNNNAI